MDLYREEILEHWQNPSHWGKMEGAHLVADQVNPLCGDRLTFYVRLSTSGKTHSRSVPGQSEAHSGNVRADRIINDISFTGNGCAISIASASILSENIKNKRLAEIRSLKGEDVLKMIGASRESFPPARLKCAFLGLEAVKKICQIVN